MSAMAKTLKKDINDALLHAALAGVDVSDTRAELARLRSAAAELQRIKELIAPLDGQSVYDAMNAMLHDDSSVEFYKVENAALLASFAPLKARNDELLMRDIGYNSEIERLHNALEAQARTIALNKYVTPPFDLTDNDTVRLALECAAKDGTLAAQAEQLRAALKIIEAGVTVYTGSVNRNGAFNAMCREFIEEYNAWLASTAPAPSPAPSVDAVAERVHAAWMKFNRENGCASRLATWGEELMTPWSELSERAKNLDRATIREVFDALAIAPAQHCQCGCGCDKLATTIDERGKPLCDNCYRDYYGIAPAPEAENGENQNG